MTIEETNKIDIISAYPGGGVVYLSVVDVRGGRGAWAAGARVGEKKDGSVVCVECKSSPTARLTRNQKKAFPEIEATGAVVVGKGKPPFVRGRNIPPHKVLIVRGKGSGNRRTSED